MQTERKGIEINDIVSEQLQVTALEEGQTATYKLCEVDNVDRSRVDEATGKHKQNSPRRLLRKNETILDPFTKRSVIIQNITGMKFEPGPDGTPREVPIVERINFPRQGALTLTHNHPGQYAYLERHPRNRDNPFRDKSKIPVFYRVNAKRKAISDMENIYLKSDALDWVKKADVTELKSIYSRLDETSRAKINPGEGVEVMKRDLFKLADEFPRLVLNASANKEARLRIQIMDAEYFNIIVFLELDDLEINKERKWVFTGKTDDEICVVPITENKYDFLSEFIMKKDNKEGKDVYNKIIEGLRKIMSPTPTAKKQKPIIAEVGSDEKGNKMKVQIDVPD